MELDHIYPEISTGEYTQFQRNTLVKLWEFITGERKIEDDKKKKGKMPTTRRVLFRTSLPKHCKGMKILTIFIFYFHNVYLSV
jgi:hypothetical protein